MTGLRFGWLLLVVLAATLLCSHVAAQDRSAALGVPQRTMPVDTERSRTLIPAPPSHAPNVRIDLLASAGIGDFLVPTTGYTRFIVTCAVEVRLALRSGDGALVRVANGTDVWGQGTGVDLDYLRRLRLEGDDRQGIGVDLSGGMTFASLKHNEDTLPLGLHVGVNVGASLDFRLSFFTFTVGVEYRLLVPTQDAIDGSPAGPEHVLTATLGIGLGTWA